MSKCGSAKIIQLENSFGIEKLISVGV